MNEYNLQFYLFCCGIRDYTNLMVFKTIYWLVDEFQMK